MSGKYAPRPGCEMCRQLGELCVNCAMDWKTKSIDDELRILRSIARMAATIPGYPGLERALARLKKHRRTKPARLAKGQERR
jgi:hypothetical protein